MFFIFLLYALQALREPIRCGPESLIGRKGYVHTELRPVGIVQLHGERWSAERVEGKEPLPAGERVQVIAIQGVRLFVRKVG
jgi:membrane-bound serine protease (ClpP class)